MLRRALTPRWILGFVVLVLFTIAAVFLGRWQWARTQSILEAERAAAASPVDIGSIVDPGAGSIRDEVVGHPVTVEGAYVPGLQVAVVNRFLAGPNQPDKPGAWIVSALRTGDGSLVAVVRGWIPEPDAKAWPAPGGDVTVTGVLQPDEPFFADAQTQPGTVAAIDSSRLAEAWGTSVSPGFVVLGSQVPMAEPAPEPVPPTVATSDVAFPLQNFFYAFQWWLFAGFAWIVYFRWLWLETNRPRGRDREQTDGDGRS